MHFQLHLRTRRCIGFRSSSHPAFRFHCVSIPGLLDAIGIFAVEELAGTCEDKFIAVDFDLCHKSFFSLLFLHPLGHCFRAAYQAGILSAASGAEMSGVEQIKKAVPFVTCEVTFGQNCLRVDVWCQCIESEF